MDQLLSLLQYLGITPQQLVPAVIIGGAYLLIARRLITTNVETIRADIKSTNNELAMIKDEVRDLHNAAKEVQIHLANDGGFTAQHSLGQKPLFERYGQHASPMQPNPKGAKLLQDSHFYDMYHELQDKIFAAMDDMNLRTLYDYEAGASRALFLLASEPAMDKVKEYAVNHPDEQLELIFGIASWVIRDEYAAHVEATRPNTSK